VKHNYKFGRDRIIKDLIEKYVQTERSEVIVAVIDYERGVARKYVEKYFNLQKLEKCECILIGISHSRKNRVLAIVFDPDIEEALVHRIAGAHLNLHQRKGLKRQEACNVLKTFLKKTSVKSIVRYLAEKIVEKSCSLKT